MIVYAAIVPHSPLLLPTVGKEHRAKLAATVAALQEVEQGLYLAKPDVVVIIAPHGARYPDAFSINLSQNYTGNFKTFGDFSTTINVKGDFMLIDHLQRLMREENVPFTLTSNGDLDYGFLVPIQLLTSHLTTKFIPISPSLLDGKAHYDFGRQLKRILHADPKRVAIIASADLSHKLGPESPGGASAEGPQFDAGIKAALETNDIAKLMAMSPSLVEGAGQCGYRPIMIMLGALDEINVSSKVLSYEAPFGVGYLTAKYDIN